jgi:hypothetical protein
LVLSLKSEDLKIFLLLLDLLLSLLVELGSLRDGILFFLELVIERLIPQLNIGVDGLITILNLSLDFLGFIFFDDNLPL